MGECLILKSGGGIDTSNATATSDKILQGYTAYVNNVLVHGSMQYQGSVNATIQAGTYYTIPEGYHSGHGWVKAEGLTDQTSGTATADKILSKYTAWVNGVLITGNMINRGAIRKTVTAEESYTIPRGYHDGNGYVVGSPLSDQTPGDASASDLLYPRTAWVNGRQVTGSMTNRGSVNKTLSAGESYTIPNGYHDGRGIVSASGIGDQTDGTATKDKILYGYTAWVNGVKLTGSMADRGSLTYQLPANGNYYIPSGYHNGNGYVHQSLSTQGGTTITPGTSSKVACASGKYTTGTIWVAGDTNLTGENIKKGVSIFGVSGTMESSKKFWIYNRWDNPYKFIEASSFNGITFTPGTAIIGSDRIRKVEGNLNARFGIKPTIPIDCTQFNNFNILVVMTAHKYNGLDIAFNDTTPINGVSYDQATVDLKELSCQLPYTKALTDNFVIGEMSKVRNTTIEIYEMWLT